MGNEAGMDVRTDVILQSEKNNAIKTTSDSSRLLFYLSIGPKEKLTLEQT